MRRRKLIRVKSPCVADHYTGPAERIVEFTGSRLGFLLSVREAADGTLRVEVYRADPGVTVRIGGQVILAPQ